MSRPGTSSTINPAAVPDVVGIGMINLDFIVSGADGSAFRHERFERGAKKPAEQSYIDEVLSRLARFTPSISPGGSALNAIAGIAATNSPTRVGYIGSCGKVSNGGFDFRDWFSLLGIDTSFVVYRESPVGQCVSCGVGEDRAMLTWHGANSEAGDLFRQRGELVLDYLLAAKVVHITPFAGVDDLSAIAQVLQELKHRCPSVTISCDPGHLWTESQRVPESDSILAAADLLILNDREFAQLSGRLPPPAMSDLDAAQRCMAEFVGVRSILVLKSYNRAVLFSRLGREVLQKTYVPRQWRSPPEDVVDDIGAGDSFAAGFLLGCSLDLDVRDRIDLGLCLASRNLEFHGMTGIHSFADEYNAFATRLLSRAQDDTVAGTPKVFIGHGHDASWLMVRDQIQSWGMVPTYFEAEPPTGRFVNEILASQALNADFAVIAMTGDDRGNNGHIRSRQNVVHEIGLMQGRLGWERVAILVEDGVERFTNLDGFQYIPFAKGRITQTFEDLRRMLRREGLLHLP